MAHQAKRQKQSKAPPTVEPAAPSVPAQPIDDEATLDNQTVDEVCEEEAQGELDEMVGQDEVGTDQEGDSAQVVL